MLQDGLEYSNFEYFTTEGNHVLTVRKQQLASLLKAIRIEAGLTQTEVARIIGQTQSYVSKYEQGEQRLDLLELEAVCRAVGVPLTEFVRRFLES